MDGFDQQKVNSRGINLVEPTVRGAHAEDTFWARLDYYPTTLADRKVSFAGPEGWDGDLYVEFRVIPWGKKSLREK